MVGILTDMAVSMTYTLNGTKSEPISRQTEIDEVLAKKILKRNGIV